MLRLSVIARRSGSATSLCARCPIAGQESVVGNGDRQRWVTRAAMEKLLQEHKVESEGSVFALSNNLLCGQKDKDDSPSSHTQREIELLVSQQDVKSRQDLVKFFDKAKKLLIAHESALQKDHLMLLLDRIGQFGDMLQAPQIRVRTFYFICTSLPEISKILSAFLLMQSTDDLRGKKRKVHTDQRPMNAHEEAVKTMYEKLMSALDLRLRQVEGKEHFPLRVDELQFILSIFKAASQLDGCTIYPALLQRLLTRAMTDPDIWTEQDMVHALDALSALGYQDRKINFCGFLLNILAKKQMVDQHELCAIVKRLAMIAPNRISNARMNTTLFKSLLEPSELTMAELTDLIDGLTKLNANILGVAMKDILDEFFERCADCTPQQLASFTFNLSTLSTDWDVVDWTVLEYCVMAALELNVRVTTFGANDLTKMIVGFVRLHFHPREPCLQRVLDQAMDILLGDGILQEQSEGDFLSIEQWLRIQGFKARAELDDLDDPHHFTNRRRVKNLKRVVGGSVDREHPDQQKQFFKNFTGEELASFLYGLAQLDAPHLTEKFFDYAKEEIMRDAIQLDVFELSLVLWAAAINGQLDRQFFLFARDRIEATDEHCNSTLVKHRVAQSLVSLRVLGSKEDVVKIEPDSYLNECYQSWLAEQCREEMVPVIVQEASKFLDELKLEYKLRQPLAAGLLVADTVIGNEQQNFALEMKPEPFDNDELRILGEERWRFKMLNALGWTVLYINEDVWDGLDDSCKQNYIRSLTGKASAHQEKSTGR